jgi:hypothetical protein
MGLASVVRALIIRRVSAEWLLPIWLLSTAAFLAGVEYIPWRRFFKRSPRSSAASYLYQMISDDKEKLGQKVAAVRWKPQPFLDEPDPRIDFEIMFINATVFEFRKPEAIHGKAKFRNRDLAFSPQLEKPFALPSREKGWMLIRQHVSREIALEMKNAISREQATLLDFSAVRIPLNGDCNGIANVSFEWAGSNEVSFKDITAP